MVLLKKLSVFISSLLAAVIIFQNINVTDMYAANLVLTGNTQGIYITPADENLFSINGMLSGETAASGIEIRNTDSFAFSLNVTVTTLEQYESSEINLLDVLKITVLMDGEELTNFPARGGNQYLGRFVPGQIAQLDILLTLDGKRTGNEYQMKNTELQWIFEAISESDVVEEPDDPDDPDELEELDDPDELDEPNEPNEPDEQIEEIDIEDEPTPLTIPEIETTTEESEYNPEDEPEIIDIPDETVPLVEIELPKTGEMSLIYYIFYGSITIGFGIVIIFVNVKEKREEIKRLRRRN